MTPWAKPLRNAAGFTLLEMTVVFLLMSGISAVTYYISAVHSWTVNRENANAQAQNQVRVAIERIVRELQLSGYDPLGTCSTCGFTLTDAAAVHYVADLNGDGSGTGEERGFDFSGGSIHALVNGSSTTLATGVQSLGFTYLDLLGQATTTASEIREVRITANLLAQGRSPGMPPSQHVLVGTAYVRN